MNNSLPRSAQRPVAASSVRMGGPSAATVVMFGKLGIVGRGMPGHFGKYSRTATR